MAIEEELKKAHQMFDSRNLMTELKWSRRNFNQIRGAISKNSKLYYTWIFDQCIKALEQEPIIDWIPVNDRLPEEKINPTTEDLYEYQCTGNIKELPSVCFKTKVGYWIYDKRIENWKCSECGRTPKTIGYVGCAEFMREHFKFCNHCGIKMEKVET